MVIEKQRDCRENLCTSRVKGQAAALTRAGAQLAAPQEAEVASGITAVDTEAGTLPGVSRKRSIRSNVNWFAEFCNSQCLSHFAAPFIVVRAEASVAERCMLLFTSAQGALAPEEWEGKASLAGRRQRRLVLCCPPALDHNAKALRRSSPPKRHFHARWFTVMCRHSCE